MNILYVGRILLNTNTYNLFFLTIIQQRIITIFLKIIKTELRISAVQMCLGNIWNFKFVLYAIL